MPQVPHLFFRINLPCEDLLQTKGSLENLSQTDTWDLSSLENEVGLPPTSNPIAS